MRLAAEASEPRPTAEGPVLPRRVRAGARAANALAFATLVAVPLAASPRFWDQFTTVKWYVLEALAVAWWLVELLLCRSRGWPGVVTRRRAAFGALAALAVAGSLGRGLSWATAPLLERAAFVMLALCWFWLFRRNGGRTGVMVLGLGMAAALVDAVGLAQAAGLRPLPWLTAGDQRSAFFGNVNMTGQFLGFAVVALLFGPGWDHGGRWARAVRSIRAAVLAASLVYLGFLSTRSVLLGLAAAGAVHTTARWRSLRTGWRLAAALSVAGVVLVTVGRFVQRDPLVGVHKIESVAQRLAVWQSTARMIAERPMGVGAGNFGLEFPPYLAEGTLAPTESLVFLSPHNEVLRVLAEEGVLVCAIAAVLLAALLRELHRSEAVERWRSGPGALLGPALAFFAVEALFQFPLGTAFGSLMAAALLGLALASVEGGASGPARREPVAAKSGRTWTLLGSLLAALVLVALARVAAAEYLFVNRRDDLRAQQRACRLNPRHTPACVTAAWLEARAGDLGPARARLVRVVRRSPYDGPAIKLLGEVALAQGDGDSGCLYLWVYDELFERRSSVHERLGLSCGPALLASFAARTAVPYGRRFPLVAADAVRR